MRRGEFIGFLGGATAWPIAARGQQATMPVVGFLFSSTFASYGGFMAGFTNGLAETSYVEGRNIAFEYRTADNHFERLPALADDLVRRGVAAIVTATNVPPALAAKTATQSVPIVFFIGANPVESGIVVNLARPGGNVTGITLLQREVMQKRLALLHELVPTAATIALLVNHTNPAVSETLLNEQVEGARRLGISLQILNASSPSEIESAFATLAQQQAGALLVGPDTLFVSQRDQLVELAARYRAPVSYFRREFVEAGELGR